jgi:hypothetical protein
MIPSEKLSGTEEIEELISYYGLEEDPEYIIVPFTDRDGKMKRRFILKRKYIRVVYAEGQFVDYPLNDVVKATVLHPDVPLSEALYLMYKEAGVGMHGLPGNNDEDVSEGNQE